MGFGYKGGYTHRHLRPLAGGAVLPTPRQDLPGQLGDAVQVFCGLGGQTDHEVELKAVPAGLKGGLYHILQVLIRHVFVDHIPQTLRPRLWGKGEPGLASLLDLLGQLHSEGVQPQGRQGDGNAAALVGCYQILNQGTDLGVITAGKGGKEISS